MKSKKGITPIIAVILLLMMTVAAAGASFYWLIKIQGEMQGGTEQYQEKTFERMASNVNWQGADFNSTNEQLTLYLQNVGTTDITLSNSSTTPTTTWILKDSDQVGICQTNWAGTAVDDSESSCVSGCDTTLAAGSTAKIVLNVGSDCNISAYASDSLIYTTIYFSGKATASGTFEK